MEFQLTDLFNYTFPALTAVAGWFAGKRKRNNDVLQEMQTSINLLADKNRELLNEVITLRGENADLKTGQKTMMLEIAQLRAENKTLRSEVERLNERLSNVKTITRRV